MLGDHRKPDSQKSSDDYENQQSELYIKWINKVFFDYPAYQVQTLSELSDGVKLLKLLEILTNGETRRYHKHPFNLMFKNENCATVLDWMSDLGIEIKFISANSIVLGELRSIMSVLWSMKRHFFKTASSRFAFTSSIHDGLEVVSVEKYSQVKKNYMVVMLHNKYLEREIQRLVSMLDAKVDDFELDMDSLDESGEFMVGLSVDESSSLKDSVDVSTSDEVIPEVPEITCESETSDDLDGESPTGELSVDSDEDIFGPASNRNQFFQSIRKTDWRNNSSVENSVLPKTGLKVGRAQWNQSSVGHFIPAPEYSYDSSSELDPSMDSSDMTSEDDTVTIESLSKKLLELKLENKLLKRGENKLKLKKNNLVEELLVAAQKIETQEKTIKTLTEEKTRIQTSFELLERQYFQTEKKSVRKDKALQKVLVEKRALESAFNRKKVFTLDEYTIIIQSRFRIFDAKKQVRDSEKKKQILQNACRRYLAKRKVKKFSGFKFYCDELVQVEKTFCDQMTKLRQEFLLPLREEEPIIPLNKLEKILPSRDLDTIIRFNTHLLDKLQGVINTEQNYYTKIAKVLQMIERIPKLYCNYVSNFPRAQSTHMKCMEKYSAYRDFVVKFEGDSLKLAAFLIMPCQRVPRYSLTYRDIYNRCPPDYVERQDLSALVLLSKDIASQVNEKKAVADARNEVLHIVKQFNLNNIKVKINKDRRFKMMDEIQCVVSRKKMTCHVALFNDLILIGRQSRTKMLLQNDESIKLIEQITFTPDSMPSINEVNSTTFELEEGKEKTVFNFDSMITMKQWYNAVSENIYTPPVAVEETIFGDINKPIFNLDLFKHSREFNELKTEFFDEEDSEKDKPKRKRKSSKPNTSRKKKKSSRKSRRTKDEKSDFDMKKRSGTVNLSRPSRERESLKVNASHHSPGERKKKERLSLKINTSSQERRRKE